ncbi:MAG: thioredoxin-disulfide reductase [Clostridiales bacterium]|jgi:thioredoxin reductase (NADPH)|nr:thioredoxin-disulfide reductase [Clostridiales bacterium]
MTEIAIIGGGPAGLTAAIYAARAGYVPTIFEKLYIGGQVVNTNEIDNYPGFPSVSGFDLMQNFENHAKNFEIKTINSEVTEIELNGNIKVIKTADNSYEAKAVIICAGASPKKLNIPGEAEFTGRGVSYCANCDGAFFRGKTVAVTGGGNTALHDAMFLSRFCEKVYIIHRRDEFRASAASVNKMKTMPKIEAVLSSVAEEIIGDSKVNAIKVKNILTGEKTEIKTDGVFVAVGTVPSSAFAKDILKDENGAILTDTQMQTNIPGVFAAGDARKTPLRQIVTAAADGAIAAACAAMYLADTEK